jgi:hypothetical protein
MKPTKQTVPPVKAATLIAAGLVKAANLCPPTSAGTSGGDGGHYAAGVRPLPDFNPSGPIPYTVPAKSAAPVPVIHPAALLPFKMPSYLLSVEADAKTDKGTASGYLTGILYLAPGTLAGVGNLCVHASAGCLAACLFTAGRAGIFEAVNAARVMRTRFLHDNRAGFIAVLKGEIAGLIRKAKRRGLRPVLRLNGTSDLPWEKLAPELFTDFSGLICYDYTKSLRRALAYARGELPKGYHLTFSLSETNAGAAGLAIAAGVNVAAVADGVKVGQRFALPGMNEGRPTFSADRHDLRFLDRKGKDGWGRIGLLKAKGKARADKSGFVIRATAAA